MGPVPLFDPRFLAYGVADELRLHRTLRYIHRNPIDICGPRGLGAYRWSSLPIYLGRRRAPDWLDCCEFLPQRPVDHLVELTGCMDDDLSPLDSLPPLHQTSLEEIGAAIAAVEHDGDFELVPREQRDVALMLALELRVVDIVAAADHFGLSESRVRQLAKQAQTRRHDDRSFDLLAGRVRHELTRS